MPTSLREIANKARADKEHRFLNLYRELNGNMLAESWGKLNKRAAVGVDRVSYQEYAANLPANIENLVGRLKAKKYKARLIRRQFIPKGDGKMRPLGIPVTEDKLVQHSGAAILSAIYEQDFLPCMHGYRPDRGAHTAVEDLRKELETGYYNHIVEADIKGYFDNIDHEWLAKFLKHRIDDRAFVGLIQKWLKAGVLTEGGGVSHPEAGTPQGGVISPILANIYMHYVLVLWFERVVKKHCRGRAALWVYADDFVCAFEYQSDAERFYAVLGKRFGKFGLTLSAEKTNIIAFGRWSQKRFSFLGFEFRRARNERKRILVRSVRKKMQKSLDAFKEWCKISRRLPLRVIVAKVNQKLRGHYNYYGVRGNSASLKWFFDTVVLTLFRWLNRRSDRKSYTWKAFHQMLKSQNILRPLLKQMPSENPKLANA